MMMMASSKGNIFRTTGPLCKEFTGQRWFSLTKASGAELCCFLDLGLNKRLSKHSGCRWFETPSRSLWCHCNGAISNGFLGNVLIWLIFYLIKKTFILGLLSGLIDFWLHPPCPRIKTNKYSLLMHCIKIKSPANFYWMSNMFLWVEIFLFFVCYHVVPKRHNQLDYELNGL